MSRFRTLDSTAPMDDDVRALMADIDASLAELEKHIESGRVEEPPTKPATKPATRPSIQPAVQPGGKAAATQPGQAAVLAAAPRETEAAPAPSQSGGFLAELERESHAATGSNKSLTEVQAADAQRIHEALGRVFQFFNSMCRYTNTLAPAINRVYRLDAQVAYGDLKWHDAATRSRQQSLQERALLDYVVFRVSMTAPAPILVVRRWDQMEAFRKEMHLLDLREDESMDVEGEVAQGQVHLRLAADFPLQITFRANYLRNRIDLLSRNLEGFGIAAFTCNPDDITQTFLDDFGRYLLARTNKLPAALARVHCRAEL